MIKLDISHDIGCDAETYWSRCFLNEAFNRELYLERLKFGGFEQLSFRDETTDGRRVRSRRVRIEPSIAGLPPLLKKMIGEKLAYTEEGSLDSATGVYSLRTQPSVFPDKTTVAGEIHVTPQAGGSGIVRTLTLTIDVRIFGVGSLAEQKVAEDVRRSYDVGAMFTNEYIRR